MGTHLVEMHRILGLVICLIVAASQEVDIVPSPGWSNPLNALSVSEADPPIFASEPEPFILESENAAVDAEADVPGDGKGLRDGIIASLKPSYFGDILDGSDLTDFGDQLTALKDRDSTDSSLDEIRSILTGQLEIHQLISTLAKRLLEHGVSSVQPSKAVKLEKLLKHVNLRVRRNQPLPFTVVEDVADFVTQCVLGYDPDCGEWGHTSRFFALFPIGDLSTIVLGLVGFSVVASKVLFGVTFMGILGARMWRGGRPTFPKLSRFARNLKTPQATFVVFVVALHAALVFPPARIFSSVSFACDVASSRSFLVLDAFLLGLGAILIAICNRLRIFSR
jgi:hypothetical protein